MRSILVMAVAVGVMSLGAGRASAQGPGRPSGPPAAASRPAFSPYLNLARRETPPAINYYGLVRPQVTAQQSFQAIQQQIGAMQGQQQTELAAGQIDPNLPTTGQPVFFLNNGGYFLNQQTGPGGFARPGATFSGRAAPPAPARNR